MEKTQQEKEDDEYWSDCDVGSSAQSITTNSISLFTELC